MVTATGRGKKGQGQLTLMDIPAPPDKIGPLMPIVLGCVNSAAGTNYPFTKAKVRFLKKIVEGTPKEGRNEQWWTEFFSWVYRANFEGRKIETSWNVDTLSKHLDKYLDAFCNKERFAFTRYSAEQAAKDEWEIVLNYVARHAPGQWSPPWGPITSDSLRAIGGANVLKSMTVRDVVMVGAGFVREWVSRSRNARPGTVRSS